MLVWFQFLMICFPHSISIFVLSIFFVVFLLLTVFPFSPLFLLLLLLLLVFKEFTFLTFPLSFIFFKESCLITLGSVKGQCLPLELFSSLSVPEHQKLVSLLLFLFGFLLLLFFIDSKFEVEPCYPIYLSRLFWTLKGMEKENFFELGFSFWHP